MNRRTALPALLLAAAPAFAQIGSSPLPEPLQAAPASRGQMLYENHCVACHTTEMHWRDQRIATDWFTLKAQVRRWQDAAHLNWSDDEIDDVARHLDERFYRFPAGSTRISRAR